MSSSIDPLSKQQVLDRARGAGASGRYAVCAVWGVVSEGGEKQADSNCASDSAL